MFRYFKKPSRLQNTRWIIGIFILLAGIFLFLDLASKSIVSHANTRQPGVGENFNDGLLRANLGGKTVAIPSYFAEYIQYDGDPRWKNSKKSKKPEKTPGPVISSFGFDARYPEMLGKSTAQLLEDYKRRKLATSQWIYVGINSARAYPGADSTDRLGRQSLKADNNSWLNRYEKLESKYYGLEVYTLTGVDPNEGRPAREHQHAKDIFLHKNQLGKITTYIICSNREIPSAPCRQFFDLEAEMEASVTVDYRRGMLPEWQQIQEKVKKTVFSFSLPE